jgi:hypothetical protein
MKQFLLTVTVMAFLLLISAPLLAEQEMLFSLEERGLGGYGGPRFSLTTLNGQLGVMGSGPLVLIRRQAYGLGFRFSSTEADIGGLNLTYAGAMAEYYLRYERRVYFSLGGFIGGGAVVFEDPDDITATRHRSAVFIVEPEALVNIRLFGYLAINLGAGYRFAAGVEGIPGIGGRELNGFSGIVALSYGLY